MRSSLEVYANETRYLVKQGVLTRKLIFPKGVPAPMLSTRDALLDAVEACISDKVRFLIFVSEEEFLETIEGIKARFRMLGETANFGFVVIAEDPALFLNEKSGFHELLDVLSEKDARKDLPFHLMRAVRHLVRMAASGNPRNAQQMLEQLNDTFIEFSRERNPQRLLATILVKAMDLIHADGGQLFMVHERDGEMMFKLSVTYDRSNEIMFHHTNKKVVENSICGYVALTGKLSNIPNIKELRAQMLPQFHRDYDHSLSGNAVSLLTIPLRNSRNETVAVLQLVNRRPTNSLGDTQVAAFEREDESLVQSFATQAAICLENVDLYADIHKLFEGFIKASITAIESRDPSTGGHSERVAKLCVGLARATTECQVGIYRSVRFTDEEMRELEYAALLHDFGKIGVREEVLVKAKKLYPHQLEAIKERIKICKAAAKIAYLEKRLRHAAQEEKHEHEFQARLKEIDQFWEIITTANEPTVLQREKLEGLDRIRHEQLLLPDGSNIGVLTEDEYQALSVTQGSLTDGERLEIESHVRHTFQFLKMIPWTKDFRNLPEIAYCHHEKLDGTGYPRGLLTHEIPIQSKIMTIADIFDALTAADRWYKEAVPTEKALAILNHEVALGQLDPVLVEIFAEKKIFELTQTKPLTKVA